MRLCWWSWVEVFIATIMKRKAVRFNFKVHSNIKQYIWKSCITRFEIYEDDLQNIVHIFSLKFI